VMSIFRFVSTMHCNKLSRLVLVSNVVFEQVYWVAPAVTT
jgi:hypothetical protein